MAEQWERKTRKFNRSAGKWEKVIRSVASVSTIELQKAATGSDRKRRAKAVKELNRRGL